MKPFRETPKLENSDERLTGFLLSTVRYVPILAGSLALGLLMIYVLSRTGVFGNAAWQLLAVATIVMLVGAAHIPIIRLVQEGRTQLAFFLFALAMAAAGLLLVIFWDSVAAVALLVVWIAPLTGIAAGMRPRRLLPWVLLSALSSAGVLWINDWHPIARLSIEESSGLAALILLASTVVLFVLGTIVVRLIRYRTLQSRLVVSFVLIIAVPILFTSAISAITAYTNSENQFRDSLHAVSSLKQAEIDSIIQDIELQMSTIQQGSGRGASILHMLYHPGADESLVQLYTSQARATVRDFIVQYPASAYEELLVLDMNGNVVLSSYGADEGTDFGTQDFFQQGSTKYFSQFVRFPSKLNPNQDYKFIAAAPFYASYGQDIRGVLVLVSNGKIIFDRLGTTAGLEDVNTYLVDPSLRVITEGSSSEIVMAPEAISNLVLARKGEESGIYNNARGVPVLGYYSWDSGINAAFVAEIPSSVVVNKALTTLLVSGLVGIFTIIIAVIAALSTSRAISEPVQSLATVATSFAAGELGARAAVEQQDEVGQLARTFNKMAEELQETIANLERRVAERTQAVEEQSLRLRTAAEVARDAASAQDPDELLERAARLIRDRFRLYHTGIFLIDGKKEFAVLRASPSEAGQVMLQNHHRLRVGEQGIVGRAAATGEPRIALDTGVDPVYFDNPFLPQTHSEMALPLKTAQGVIGVLDIQSDQPEAFTQDDIAIVQTMADQLATAIERARLLQNAQANLAQVERAYQEFTEQSWRVFERAGRQTLGYRFDNIRLEPITEAKGGNGSEPAESSETLANDVAAGERVPDDAVVFPLRLRGQTIGQIHLRFQSGRPSEPVLAMITQIADRLAAALENARLLEDSLHRANKERVISDITAKISASVNMRNVLQTAVEELGRAIPGSDVMIQFGTDLEIQGREEQP